MKLLECFYAPLSLYKFVILQLRYSAFIMLYISLSVKG